MNLPFEGSVPLSLESVVQEDLSLKPCSVISLKTGGFPKSARLLKSFQYRQLHRNSKRLFGLMILVQFQQGRSSCSKLGITVSKKFGKAHRRNRFKRLVREAFRELRPLLPPSLEINISPQKNVDVVSKQALLIELKEILDKILKSLPCSPI